jgi:AraC-like DNA-binding protein
MFGTKTISEKPVQLYHIGDPLVECHLLEPDDRLKEGIFYFWHIDIASGPVNLAVIPDNAIDLVMSPDVADFSALYFPVAEKFSIRLEGPVRYIGVCFQLDQLSHFFDIPTSELRSVADGVNMTETLGISSLVNSLQGLGDLNKIKHVLDSAFCDRISESRTLNGKAAPLRVAQCIEAMQQTLGDDGVWAIAARFDLSDRQFRRILTNMFGFGPKKVQRIVRLQLALKDLMQCKAGATLDGYYDDAHRIRELRSLTGMTPGDIRRMAEIYNQLD